ncbi:MAG TPA: MMPL family transporter, partial [Pilimelia sp.]|nr:MMPL family transporter [Pilimelia sp.]
MPAAVQRAAWWWALATAVILPLLAAAAIALAGPAPVRPGAADGLPRDADSTLATALRAQLPEAPGSAATVLFSTDGAPLGPAAVAALTAKAAVLAPLGGAPAPTAGPASGPGTAGPTPTPAPPGLVVSVDRTAAVATVAVAASDASGQAEAVRRLRAEARTGLPPGVNAQVTGPAGITADLAAVFDGANTTLLAATAAVVAVLLMLTYRSPLLWVLPLAVVGLADQLAATVATRVLRATGQAWDESTVGILSVLVFGAGTDYALLLISRYRDELRGTADRFAAMRQAVRHTVEPVLASAGTVVGALLALLLSLFPTTRGLGLACAVGVVIAAAAVLLLLPAVLVLPGRWVFWPRVPHLGEPALVDGRSPWRRVGEAVARRPRAYAAGAVLLLAALAGGTLRVETGLPQ